MSADEDLFSLAAAREARDASIAQVEENADEEWKRVALDTIHQVALSQDTFIADDIHKILNDLPVETREKRALGALLLRARSMGWIQSTRTYAQSAQKHCHANMITVWRSLLFS